MAVNPMHQIYRERRRQADLANVPTIDVRMPYLLDDNQQVMQQIEEQALPIQQDTQASVTDEELSRLVSEYMRLVGSQQPNQADIFTQEPTDNEMQMGDNVIAVNKMLGDETRQVTPYIPEDETLISSIKSVTDFPATQSFNGNIRPSAKGNQFREFTKGPNVSYLDAIADVLAEMFGPTNQQQQTAFDAYKALKQGNQ